VPESERDEMAQTGAGVECAGEAATGVSDGVSGGGGGGVDSTSSAEGAGAIVAEGASEDIVVDSEAVTVAVASRYPPILSFLGSSEFSGGAPC
jgi:hypothetical protein